MWYARHMDTIFFDFETFYSSDYTLRKLDPPSYVLSPMFEAICLGVARNSDPPFLVNGPQIPDFLNELDRNCAVVIHNALFDMCICSWRYQFVPKLIIDTLAMSRSLLGHKLKSNSLRKVAEHLGLPPKGDILQNVKGMTRADIIACGMWAAFGDYNLHDVELCRSIYLELAPLLPDEEFLIHDMVARCAVEPIFKLEPTILAEHLQQVRSEKDKALADAMTVGCSGKPELMSNPQFADLLRKLGVDPPLKISNTT